MLSMNKVEQDFLLKLARKSIEHYLNHSSQLGISDSDLPSKELLTKQACFVTLTKDGQLRGCVGHLEPMQPLYKDVIENATAAAFFDTRFLPVTIGELPEIRIEISILSEPKNISYQTIEQLIKLLSDTRPGVIIQRGIFKATFLPQVWEELSSPEDFLSNLCLKAGLSTNDWKGDNFKVFIYTVLAFQEL